jgi:arabinogalactan endo-1,4-beta-galactosidase
LICDFIGDCGLKIGDLLMIADCRLSAAVQRRSMRRTVIATAWLTMCIAPMWGPASAGPDMAALFAQTPRSSSTAIASAAFIVGADISSVQAAEARGVRYSDRGVQKDILAILKDHGFNFVRLRVFNDPTKPTPRDRAYSLAGYCDLAHTIEMAKRVKAMGMGLLIDFHYSDSWADPAKQFTPSAWADLTFDDLVARMHAWTKDAIEQMRAAGVQPDIVQIGNEITPGLMTDRGGSTRDWNQLARLLNAGIAGVKDVDPAIRVMLHIDKGGDNAATHRWVDAALSHGVRFDILGLSCYTRWQGPPDNWKANFTDLAARYPALSFVMAEIGGEAREASAIMRGIPDHRGLGTFVWEPTSINNGQALFDRDGAVIPEKMAAYDEISVGADNVGAGNVGADFSRP